MAALKPAQYKKQIKEFKTDSLISLEREFNNAIEYFKEDKDIVKELKKQKAEFTFKYYELINKTLDDNSKYFALTQI